ncbi:MAG: hypothetical protein JST80_03545 [Bdellovibrionales bacterium]|nr:hypothetical protein [Bdellovibrionales bacterium]
MSSVSDATTRLQESYDLERKQSREANERREEERNEKYEDQLRAKKEEYNARLNRIRTDAQADVRKLKEEMYDKSGKSTNRAYQEQQETKNQLARYKEDLDRDADRKINRIERSARERAAKAESSEGDRVEQALAAQRHSHAREIADMKDEIARYRVDPRDIDAERAKAREESVTEYESNNIKERDRIVDAYEKSIDKMHQKQEEMDDHYSRRLVENSANANAKSERQLRNQKEEFTKIDRERQDQINRLEDHYDEEIRKEKSRNDRTTNTLITQNSTDKEKALQRQGETYDKYIKDTKNKTDFERTSLEADNRMLRTTSDPTRVSPYVVDKIEKKAEMRYYTQLQEANDVNQRNLDATRARDQADRQDLRDHYNESLSSKARDQQRSQDLEKRQFLGAYDDLQHLRESERQETKNRYDASMTRTLNKQALDDSLNQKRHKEELKTQRDTLHDDRMRSEDEINLKNKENTRSLTARINEQRRDYERKMAEERDLHDTRIQEMRFEYDKKLRDESRKANKNLEDRVKSYEHQIRQQELAFKEKERFLTEHYEEEIDRMKNTNARLIQKKS